MKWRILITMIPFCLLGVAICTIAALEDRAYAQDRKQRLAPSTAVSSQEITADVSIEVDHTAASKRGILVSELVAAVKDALTTHSKLPLEQLLEMEIESATHEKVRLKEIAKVNVVLSLRK